MTAPYRPPVPSIGTAVLLAFIAWQVVPLMDGLAKYLSAWYPVLQIVWARFFFHFLIVFPLVLWRHGRSGFIVPRAGLQIARGGWLLIATLTFFGAIRYIPLANAVALVFIEPILLTFLSAWVLKERVVRRDLIAVLLGFVAVLIIIRPGFEGFHWASLLVLVTALAFALYLLSTRMLAGSAPPLVTLAFQSLLGVVVMTATLPLYWKTPSLTHGLMMVAIGAIAALGHFLVIAAFERAPASKLAALNYTEIIMATIVGYVAFGDFPDPWAWSGIAMIVLVALWVSRPPAVAAPSTVDLRPPATTASAPTDRSSADRSVPP